MTIIKLLLETLGCLIDKLLIGRLRDVWTKTDGFDELFENIEEIGVGLDESDEVVGRLRTHLDDESERAELMLKFS